MGQQANTFLTSFNRIEKWLKEALDSPRNMGFTQMVRRLASRSDLPIKHYEEDLIQISQLRNAIVHEQVREDFIIAEPNQWIVHRILTIEAALLQPELVLPRFGKKVTGFEQTLPLTELLKIVAKKRYSQFPLYEKGIFTGLITLKDIGYWVAKESLMGDLYFKNKVARDLILSDGKTINYQFVAKDCPITVVEAMFKETALLEAILITPDGNQNGQLLGIIRPRDLLNL
ncbi:CBS domain-containing protein [Enterococcus sp. LJL98]